MYSVTGTHNRFSTPATRKAKRTLANALGHLERSRSLSKLQTPKVIAPVAVVAFYGFLIIACQLIDSVNL
jgi:hypothetical protein